MLLLYHWRQPICYLYQTRAVYSLLYQRTFDQVLDLLV
nr:MAG TPA: hypothetical protein [Caudoviricetes sp.]